MVSGLSDLLATSHIGLLQMASKFEEIGAAARLKIGEQFKKLGLELTDLIVNNISPPDEVQKAIDARSSMSAIGDLRSYTLYQAANGLAASATEGAGAAGSMAALGMGAGLGMMLPPILQQALQAPTPAVTAAVGSAPAPQVAAEGGMQSIQQIQQTLRGLGQQLGWSITEGARNGR